MGNAVALEDTNGNRKLLKKRREEKIDKLNSNSDVEVLNDNSVLLSFKSGNLLRIDIAASIVANVSLFICLMFAILF